MSSKRHRDIAQTGSIRVSTTRSAREGCVSTIGSSDGDRKHGESGGQRGSDEDVLDAAFRDVGAHIMGRRVFGGDPLLEPVEVVAAPPVTHVKTRVRR